MALVISDSDYKRVTILSKVAGIMTVAASTIMLIDHQSPMWFAILLPLGMLFTLAPLPMTVVKPEGVAAEEDGYLTLNE